MSSRDAWVLYMRGNVQGTAPSGFTALSSKDVRPM